ncbi:pseudouridylate synthase [Leptospira santarosai str. ST188]|uniref:Pseudouridine synthase n=2 Tax=Leptospira santarosai TaxID=28183 RepID=A0AB73MYU2_9LEPT|nr:pseudouridylate synthase [Leptospira santarosai str. ST188]EMO73596.1 pseudouridylate synthase [Leptospira santarosai str. 200403458]EMP00429.1 pseudouridylate synthase [Leptospira santarosai str. 200702252]OLY60847.1 pseudouridylate synthase [Leptospira santarosai serovar Guaricura]OLY64583.1 pseudouridylate synthase [Leptospira santarosai serovar Grippotyphosa]ONF80585.1 pseudouridylate synthase [Leptospira santarosai serovar Bananal]ONF89978.1 pseudouridylate synthase [Leptospira santar
MILFEMEESMLSKNDSNARREIRLNRFLADCGLGSRRKTEELILRGQITINGKQVTDLGTKVELGRDVVSYLGNVVKPTEEPKKVLILNKPVGYLCSHGDRFHEKTVFSLLPSAYKSFKIAGRLDLNSRGLLILTNDGELAQRISHPSNGSEKEYLVTLNHDPGEKWIQSAFRKGIVDAGEILRAKMVQLVPGGDCVYRITLGEGKRRQIRRMFRASGASVIDLQRIRIGSIQLEKLDLKEGEFLLTDTGIWK